MGADSEVWVRTAVESVRTADTAGPRRRTTRRATLVVSLAGRIYGPSTGREHSISPRVVIFFCVGSGWGWALVSVGFVIILIVR